MRRLILTSACALAAGCGPRLADCEPGLERWTPFPGEPWRLGGAPVGAAQGADGQNWLTALGPDIVSDLPVTDEAREQALASPWSLALRSPDGAGLRYDAELPQQALAFATADAADCGSCEGDLVVVATNNSAAIVAVEVGADAIAEASRGDLDLVVHSLTRAPEGWLAGFGPYGGRVWVWDAGELTTRQSLNAPAADVRTGDLVAADLDGDGHSELIAAWGANALVYPADPTGERLLDDDPVAWDLTPWLPSTDEAVVALASWRSDEGAAATLIVALGDDTRGRVCAFHTKDRRDTLDPDQTDCADLPFEGAPGSRLRVAVGDVWRNDGGDVPEVIVGAPSAGAGRGGVAIYALREGHLAPHPILLEGSRADAAFGASVSISGGALHVGEPGMGDQDGEVVTVTAQCP